MEMEAAALFAVAEYRGAEVGAMFTISDTLASLEWHPEFHSDRTRTGLETLYHVALQCLTAEADTTDSGAAPNGGLPALS